MAPGRADSQETAVSDGSPESSVADSASTGGVKRRDRADQLRRLFRLPPDECLVDDFICALRRRMLHQGRLYVFEHYACFYSQIFNYQKLLVIPLKDVTAIRKKKHYGFPNSIEIVWKGKKDFFTSFLKRDAAHKLLSYAWSKSTPYAKLFGGVDSDAQAPPAVAVLGTSAGSETKKKWSSVKLAKLLQRPQAEPSSPREAPPANDDAPDSEELQLYHTAKQGLNADSMSEQLTERSHDMETESDDDSELAVEGLEKWGAASGPAPPIDPNMTLLVEDEFDMPVKEFYKEFFSEQSQFFVTWHEARGDTKIQHTEWQKHAVGFVRELSFITPLKQRLGPSKCMCNQTQRARLHPGDHFVFETSQIMDIPYGDHFSVETRWDVAPAADGKHCKVEIRLAIPFSKKTMFKGTIESSTKNLVKDALTDWVATAKRWMEPPIQVSTPVNSAFANGPAAQDSSDNFQEPTHLSRAQSLAVRLSSDRLPDGELLLRSPTTARSDIARLLQIRRRETERQTASARSSRMSMDRPRSRGVSFETPPQRVSTWPRLWPLLSSVAVGVIVFQVLYLCWQKQGWQLPEFLGSLLPEVHPTAWLRGLTGSQGQAAPPSIADVYHHVEALHRSVGELQKQLSALPARLEVCDSAISG